MNILSKIWNSTPLIFEPIQKVLNGGFWKVFESKFAKYGKGSVADLGCGTGELRNHISPTKYLGIDLNARFVKFAKARFRSEGARFVVGDVTKLGKIEDFPKTVFIVGVFHHLSDGRIKKLLIDLKGRDIVKAIVVDGFPIGPLAPALSFFDGYLSGGHFFRGERGLVRLATPFLKVIESGTLRVPDSFYKYPYVILEKK